jgi:hypothetical protein
MFRADFPPFALETVEHSRHLPIRRQIQHPIYFVRGDHDEATWLRQLLQSQQNKTIPIDPFDLFHYVPDGMIIHSGGLKLAFFGGVEHPERGKEGTEHDPAAFTALLGTTCSEVDVLITHEPPTGVALAFTVKFRDHHKLVS